MMKTWLIRRAVPMPVSLRTTSAISSSVWRLPFIKALASPARTISTAFAAAAWLCGALTNCIPSRSRASDAASARILASGPTRIGLINFACAASSAPASEVSSQG